MKATGIACFHFLLICVNPFFHENWTSKTHLDAHLHRGDEALVKFIIYESANMA